MTTVDEVIKAWADEKWPEPQSNVVKEEAVEEPEVADDGTDIPF